MRNSAENLTPNQFPYPSCRMPVLAVRGVVATSQPLAAQAGLQMLQRGGNAVDAAIATAITLTVVEPTSNGIGSDAFALIWDGKQLHGLNGSGRAPATHTPLLFAQLGHTAVPARGWLPVTVPGAPALWRDLHAKFGRLPFESLFEPAIYYAEHGYPVSPVTAAGWGAAARLYATNVEPEYRGWFETFTAGGQAPKAGDLWSSPGHARTLRLIAESRSDAFYSGEIARTIARSRRSPRKPEAILPAATWRRTPARGSTPSAPATAATTCGRSRPMGRASPPSPRSISWRVSTSRATRASRSRAITCKSSA